TGGDLVRGRDSGRRCWRHVPCGADRQPGRNAVSLTPPPIPATEHLRLRAADLEDAEEVFATYARDPEVTRYLSFRPHQHVAAVARLPPALRRELGRRGAVHVAHHTARGRSSPRRDRRPTSGPSRRAGLRAGP